MLLLVSLLLTVVFAPLVALLSLVEFFDVFTVDSVEKEVDRSASALLRSAAVVR